MKQYKRSFAHDFAAICKKNCEEIVIIYDTGFKTISYSYSQVEEYVGRFLYFFKEKGLAQGDTIMSLLPNSAEDIICFLAVMKGGYTFAPLPCHATNREIEKWMNIIKPKLIFKKLEVDSAQSLNSDDDLISLKCDGDLEWLPMEKYENDEIKSATLYLFTSGTTGEPKAMVLNGDTLWSSGFIFSRFYNLHDSKTRFWNYLPMSYLGGLFNLALIPICCGGSFLITEPFSGKTVISFWNTVKKHEITALWFVPTIVNGLLRLARMFGNNFIDYCKDNLKIAFLGTAPISKESKEEFEKELGVQMYENYALSETTFITGETKESLCFRKQASVGEFLPYVDYELRPYENSKNIFELWVQTPFMFEGYLNESGEIEQNVDNNGFLNTKDLVTIDENNQLIVAGRDRDIIKKGGLFVSLKEIEYLVAKLDYVQDVAAVPIKHEFYGENYVLYVILKYGQSEDMVETLRLWMFDNIVQYKMPETIKVCKEFPHTDSGKIKKEELRKQYESENIT